MRYRAARRWASGRSPSRALTIWIRSSGVWMTVDMAVVMMQCIHQERQVNGCIHTGAGTPPICASVVVASWNGCTPPPPASAQPSLRPSPGPAQQSPTERDMNLIGVDVGGTFTDLVYFNTESHQVSIHKLPTTVEDPSQGIVAGIRALCDDVGIQP